MNKAFPLPLAVYFVLRDLLTQQLQSRLVDTIYAAIVIDLRRHNCARKVAGGDDESGIATRCRLADAAGIEQQYFISGMQLRQPPGAGQPR
jgi:hypothetical protein